MSDTKTPTVAEVLLMFDEAWDHIASFIPADVKAGIADVFVMGAVRARVKEAVEALAASAAPPAEIPEDVWPLVAELLHAQTDYLHNPGHKSFIRVGRAREALGYGLQLARCRFERAEAEARTVRTHLLNFEADLRRLIAGEPTLCHFVVVDEVRDAINEAREAAEATATAPVEAPFAVSREFLDRAAGMLDNLATKLREGGRL